MSIGRNIISNWLGLIVGGLAGIVLAPILVHRLGDTFYGIWILASSLLDYSGLLDNGMRVAMFRFIARFSGSNDREALNRTLSTSLALSWASGAVLLSLLPAIAIFAPRWFPSALADQSVFRVTLTLVGFSLALMFPARVLGGYMSGVRRFDLYNVGAIGTVVLRSVWMAVALLLGHGIVAVAWATFGSSLIALALNYFLLRLADPQVRVEWRSVRWDSAVELVSYGIFAFFNYCGEQLRNYTDSLVIARVLTVALVTPFAIASKLIEYCRQIFSAALGPLMGRMSELDGASGHADLEHFYLRTTRYMAIASLFLGALLALDGKALIRAWMGPGYDMSYYLLAWLLVGYVPLFIQGPSTNLLMALAKHRFLALIRLMEGVSNLALSIYWAHRYGLVGVAAGTTVPLLVTQIVIEPWYVFAVIGLRPYRFVHDALARPLFAGAVWLAICLVPGAPQAAGGWLRLGGALAYHCFAFAFTTLFIGLTSWERQFLRSALKRFTAGRDSIAVVGA